MHIYKRFLPVIAMLGLVLAVSACSPRAHTRGNLPDPKKVSQLKVGDISREEVIEFLGSPSSRASFGDEVWFYISEQTETHRAHLPVHVVLLKNGHHSRRGKS